MSEAVLPRHPFFARLTDVDAKPVSPPKPRPIGTPVFIMDAVTPLAGETVLSLLMKRMMSEDKSAKDH